MGECGRWQPCCLSLAMHYRMTANLVWLVHNGRSRTQLYEQSFPHSSSQQPTEEGQKESKYSGQALVLYRPWKTSLLEAAGQ